MEGEVSLENLRWGGLESIHGDNMGEAPKKNRK